MGSSMSENIPVEFTYMNQPPKRYTFEMPKLKQWVEEHCQGNVLNLFAGKVILDFGCNSSVHCLKETRVDIDPTMPQIDYVMDSYEFVKMAIEKGMKWDTVILDPPYNMRKSREKYGDRWIGSFTKIKDLIPQIVSEHGRTISFGYDTVGMSKSRGFQKIGICIICHNGDHQDTLAIYEGKC
jgi:hypothetical protein